MDLVHEIESDKSLKLFVHWIFGRLYKTVEGVCWAHCKLSTKLPKGVQTYCMTHMIQSLSPANSLPPDVYKCLFACQLSLAEIQSEQFHWDDEFPMWAGFI